MVRACSCGSSLLRKLSQAHRASTCTHLDALAVGHLQRRAVLEDAGAVADQGLGFAEQQVERMHVATAHVQQGAAVGVAADDLAYLRASQEADLVTVVDRLEVLFPGPQGLFLTAVEAHVAVTVAKIGIDGVARDALLDDAGAELADFEDLLQALVADTAPDLFQIVADARHDLPTVAPGAPETQVAGLEHDDIGDAFLCQFQGGVDPREAAADDHDIRFDVALQRGKAQVVFLRRRVVGRGLEGNHDAACWNGVVIGPLSMALAPGFIERLTIGRRLARACQ